MTHRVAIGAAGSRFDGPALLTAKLSCFNALSATK
jgi:hypothetical protein